jgi:hypothetical protein
MNAFGGWKNIPKVIVECTEILTSATKMTEAVAGFGDAVTHVFDKEPEKNKEDDDLDRRIKRLSSSFERPSRNTFQELDALLR